MTAREFLNKPTYFRDNLDRRSFPIGKNVKTRKPPQGFSQATEWAALENEAAIGELANGVCGELGAKRPRPLMIEVHACVRASKVAFAMTARLCRRSITTRHAGESGELPHVAGSDVG